MDPPPVANRNVGRRPRTEQGRKCWNNEEEDVLLSCLKELVNAGWKSDNGFRGGYITKLEELMRVHFPRANIRANPHITSKLTGWKKNYGTLSYVLGRNGVGFNLHGDFKVDCDDDLWEQMSHVDPNVKFIKEKSWPMYDRWAEVFGWDRATGGSAEDVFEAVNHLIIEDNTHHPTDEELDSGLNASPFPHLHEETENSDANITRNQAGRSRGFKKRKLMDNTDKELRELIQQLQLDANTHLASISHRIGYQSDLAIARRDVWALLKEIPEITTSQRFDVSDILIESPNKLEFFTGLPAAQRPEYVERLLLDKGV